MKFDIFLVSVAKARWTGNWASFVESMIQLCLFHEGETTQEARTVSFVEKLDLSFPLLPTKPCGNFHQPACFDFVNDLTSRPENRIRLLN